MNAHFRHWKSLLGEMPSEKIILWKYDKLHFRASSKTSKSLHKMTKSQVWLSKDAFWWIFQHLTVSVSYVNLIKQRAEDEIKNFAFVLKFCRGVKYTVAHDLDLSHAQRCLIHILRITRVYRAYSTSLDVGQASAQNRGCTVCVHTSHIHHITYLLVTAPALHSK